MGDVLAFQLSGLEPRPDTDSPFQAALDDEIRRFIKDTNTPAPPRSALAVDADDTRRAMGLALPDTGQSFYAWGDPRDPGGFHIEPARWST